MKSELSPMRELRTPPRGVVVLDLDGVITRTVQYQTPHGPSDAFVPESDAVAQFAHTISTLRQKNVLPLVLTNRPPGQMHLYTTMLGVTEGMWVTENGASLYDVVGHKAAIHPDYIHYAQHIAPNIRDVLVESCGVSAYPAGVDTAQFEPGMGYVKTVIRPPEHMTATDWVTEVNLKKHIGAYWSDISIKPGKSVDIDPAKLSKAGGMTALFVANGIDPNSIPVAFIADAQRDIDGARALLTMGSRVTIGAVGNAQKDFREFVSEIGGVLAPHETRFHSSANFIIEKFLAQNKL